MYRLVYIYTNNHCQKGIAMITEIRGIAGSGKSSRIYTLIGESLAAGRTVFLIVPEQTAVSAERRLSV